GLGLGLASTDTGAGCFGAVLVVVWAKGRCGRTRQWRCQQAQQGRAQGTGCLHCTGATALVNIRPNGHPRWRPPRPPYYAASCCPLKSHRAKNVLFRADYSGQLSSEQGGEGVTDQGRMLAAGPPLRCNVARHSAADSVRDAPSGGWRAETRCKL
ncbi:hypothetical protein BGZ61DRAFT_549105, partial [Ilyonectria robusta]|uniref:uncharacterized protein n=1 Tax=Ilyonectria robusta TaxID=1079257 RepID=UPI001E8CE6D8